MSFRRTSALLHVDTLERIALALERVASTLERQELHSLEAETGCERPVGINDASWRDVLKARVVERRFRNVRRTVGVPYRGAPDDGDDG